MTTEVERLKKLIQSVDADKIIGMVLDSHMRVYFNHGERFNYNKHIKEDIECIVIEAIDTNEYPYTLYMPIKYIESFLVSADAPVETFSMRYIG